MSRVWFPMRAAHTPGVAVSCGALPGEAAPSSSDRHPHDLPSTRSHGLSTPAARWRRSLDTLFASAFLRRAEGADPWAACTRPWDASTPATTGRAGVRLSEARTAYLDAIRDLPRERLAHDAPGLCADLELATRSQELWAQRPAIFLVVARCFSQVEAQRRLDALDARCPPPRSASRPRRGPPQCSRPRPRPGGVAPVTSARTR